MPRAKKPKPNNADLEALGLMTAEGTLTRIEHDLEAGSVPTGVSELDRDLVNLFYGLRGSEGRAQVLLSRVISSLRKRGLLTIGAE